MEKTRQDSEMQLARRVMEGLLPRESPGQLNLDVAAFHVWSREVGGDYYDFIPLGDDRWGLVIADVVGKGMAAALLVSAIRASIISLAGLELAMRAIFRRANRFFHDSTEEGRYVTLFYTILDVQTRRMIYVNAGHLPALLVRTDGRVEELSEGGVPLGLFPESRYDEGFARLNPGDVLALYTDGITDALDAEDRPFGLERLTAALREARTGNAATIVDAVVDELRRFAGDRIDDDETLVLIKAT